MRFQIEFAKRTRIFDAALGREVPLRTYSSILAALGGSEGEVSRLELTERIWPGVSPSAARNRLRVALTALRKVLPGAMVETPSGLRLDSAVVQVDIWDIQEAIHQVENTVTPAAEMDALAAALAPLSNGAAFAPHRLAARPFVAEILKAALRLHDLAKSHAKPQLAMDAAVLAATLGDDSPAAWEAFLFSHWEAGQADAALQIFRQSAPPDVQKSPAVTDAVKALRKPYKPRNKTLPDEQAAVMVEAFAQLETSRPDLWRAVLSAPEALAVAGKYPRQMHDLLERATPLDSAIEEEAWRLSAGRLIGLKAWLNDANGVLLSAPVVLSGTDDPHILRAVWNAVAIAHSLLRQWPEAMEALDKAATYARAMGSEIYEISAIGNGAFFLMHQSRYEEADRQYESTFGRLRDMNTPQADFEYAVAIGNKALIPVYRQDWPEAVRRLEDAMQIRAGSGLQMGLLQAGLALSQARLGQLKQVPNLMRAGFVDAFQADSAPLQMATFEFAAGALSGTLHEGYGGALLDWVGRWRAQAGFPRSNAEGSLCESFHHSMGEEHIPDGELVTAVGREAMKRLRSIRSGA